MVLHFRYSEHVVTRLLQSLVFLTIVLLCCMIAADYVITKE